MMSGELGTSEALDMRDLADPSAGAAIAVVDHVLAKIGSRELVPSQEATTLVQELRQATGPGRVIELLDALLTECTTSQLISSARLADALLDVRLELAAAAADADAGSLVGVA